MTKREQQVKEEIIKLLRANKHNKYAARFELLDFNIVPAGGPDGDPNFTAAISFEDATVYLSENFLNGDRAIFNQLDFVLRHELAHHLMLHMIRMAHKIGDDKYYHIKFSELQSAFNVIADDEISNTRYSAADKITARNLIMASRTIRGLVTEDHRPEWAELTLEEMYEKLIEESKYLHNRLLAFWRGNAPEPDLANIYDPDYADAVYLSFLDREKLQRTGKIDYIHNYTNTTSPSRIRCPIDIFIKTDDFKHAASELQHLIIRLKDALEGETDQNIFNDLLEEIAQSAPLEFIDIKVHGKLITTLYSPQEKMIASDVIKLLQGNIKFDPTKFTIRRKVNSSEYRKAYNRTMKAFDKPAVSNKALADAIDAIMQALARKNSGDDITVTTKDDIDTDD